MEKPPMFDEKSAQRVDVVYSSDDEIKQRMFVMDALAPRVGERIIDIGSGPGYVLREIGEAVGPSGSAVGVEPAEAMVKLARNRCAGLDQVTLREGNAEALPADDREFDAAVITQVYEYVPNVIVALRELYRLLRPGGRAVILDTDWDSLVWNAKDSARAKRILKAWDSHLSDPHLPRTLSARLLEAGFEIMRRDVYSILNPDYKPGCYSFGMIGIIAPFVIRFCNLPKEEVKAWAAELEDLGREGEYFFSLNRYLFVCKKIKEQ